MFLWCLLQSSCIRLDCITILMFIDLAIKKNRNRVHLIKPLHLCLINIFQTTGSQLTLYLTAFNGVLEDITTKGHFAFDIWSYSWLLHRVVTSFIWKKKKTLYTKNTFSVIYNKVQLYWMSHKNHLSGQSNGMVSLCQTAHFTPTIYSFLIPELLIEPCCG